MKTPKTFMCSSMEEAMALVDYYNRPILVNIGGTIGRIHPSGKFQEIDVALIDKILKRGEIVEVKDEKAKNVSTAQPASVSARK